MRLRRFWPAGLRRRWRAWSVGTRIVALSLLAALLLLRYWDPQPVETLRLHVFDYYQTIAPREATVLPVVIVDIDEKSLGEIGQWPWPRTTLAEMVNRLSNAGVVSIGFDVVFPEPDRLSPANLARSLSGLPPEAAEALAKLPSNDEVFAETIKSRRVVLGRAARQVGQGDPTPARTTPVALISTPGAKGIDPRQKLVRFGGVVRNIPLLEDAAPGIGVFMLDEERDNIVRRVPMAIASGDQIYPSLSLEMLRVAVQKNAYAIRSNGAGVESFIVGSAGAGGVQIPTDDLGRVWVHFARPDPRRYVSAADVLAGRVPPEQLKGKLRDRRYLRCRTPRHQGDRGRAFHAGSRGARSAHRADPGAGDRPRSREQADRAPQLGARRRVASRRLRRHRDHRSAADGRRVVGARHRHGGAGRARRRRLAPLYGGRAAGRRHLSRLCHLRPLFVADLRRLCARGETAAQYPVPVLALRASQGRRQAHRGSEPRQTRWRGARDDDCCSPT